MVFQRHASEGGMREGREQVKATGEEGRPTSRARAL